MRMYLGIVKRKDSALSDEETDFRLAILNQRLEGLARRSFPSPAELVKHSAWASSSGIVSLHGWTNEPVSENQPILSVSAPAGTVVGRAGYLYGNSELDFAKTSDQLGLAGKTGGCFGILRGEAASLTATTDATRSAGLYWGTTTTFRVVANRALLVHLCMESDRLNSDDPDPIYDLFSTRTFGSVGYFMGNLTPFTGVEAIEESTTLRLDPWMARKESDPVTAADPMDSQDPEWQSLVEQSSSMLVEAYGPVMDSISNLSLTGGRDSRLLASALYASGKNDFIAATSGVEGHPDVYLAQEISRILGFKHELRSPAQSLSGHVLAEEPLSRIIRNLDVHDGFTTAWDDIQTYGPMSMQPSISGVGGEIMRGGLVLQNLDNLDGASAANSIRNTMTGGGQLFRSLWMERARAYAAPWVEQAQVDPFGSVDRFYHVHRNGRWVSARRSGARFRAMAIDPLLDNRLIRSVLRVDAESRWNERLVYDMIKFMTPQLSNLPLEGERWRFERGQAQSSASTEERDSWNLRTGMKPTPQASRYAWHHLANLNVRSLLEKVILDRLTGPAAELFDPVEVHKLLSAEDIRYPAQFWHIASTCVLLTDPWHRTMRPAKVAAIEVPVAG